MSAPSTDRVPPARTAPPSSVPGFVSAYGSRTTGKFLPSHARGHNRTLVLQTLYTNGARSRADLARETGLTRVVISELIAQFIVEGIVVELGHRDQSGPGKPATLVDIDRHGHTVIGLDLSDYCRFHGAVLDLDGTVLHRAAVLSDGVQGDDALEKVLELIHTLLAKASPTTVLGIGIGTPGVVDFDGVVRTAANLGWHDLPLRDLVEEASSHTVAVAVANDANLAALAEFADCAQEQDLMLIRVGRGVGAGLVIGGNVVAGGRFAAGEIGHVVVGTHGHTLECACGKFGCLETWLGEPWMTDALAAATDAEARERVITEAGDRLGIMLAPIVGALNLEKFVLSVSNAAIGPGLIESALATLRRRTMDSIQGDPTFQLSRLGDDGVLRGTVALVTSAQLGIV